MSEATRRGVSAGMLMALAVVSTYPASGSESATDGKELFNTVGCWSCHGFNGQGAMSRGIASGPHINARVLPEPAFLRQLRAPVGVMPPYSADVLTDAQVEAIYNYLRSLPVATTAKDIPLLSRP
jgi:mono/diheme cytochrome c family protein